MELREKMIRFRAENNMSQKDFAKLCKLTVQTIHYVEKGLQNPTDLTRTKIELAMKKNEKGGE